MKKTAVMALGGNAIIKPGQKGTHVEQFENTRASLGGIIKLLQQDYNLAITHGNGPQVGHYLRRAEAARDILPLVPLGICVAGTEGEMGYMIAQSLQNALKTHDIQRDITAILTQVLVDPDDNSFHHPNKPVGSFFSAEQAATLIADEGWDMKENSWGTWRRVVPSPMPLLILEGKQIKRMVERGNIVIACGGGGIPVCNLPDGRISGVDAVIDKDRASAVLALQIKAQELIISTNVNRVCIHFGTPEMQELPEMDVATAQKYLDAGEFPAGSMGPKVEAAIDFLRNGGEKVIIAANDTLVQALQGETGTHIYP